MPPSALEQPTNNPPLRPAFQPPVSVERVPSALETKTYVVQSGDSLSLIAKRYNATTRDLMSLNGLTSPNKLRVGQKLKLPGYADLSAAKPVVKHKAAPAAHAKAGAHAAVGAGEYAVKSGDSLGKIAKAHGTTIKAIKEANGLTSDALKVGQKLKLPGAAAAPAPAGAEGAPQPAAAPEAGPTVNVQPEAAPPMVGTPTAPGAGDGSTMVHIVDANQELNEIAMMYGVRVEELMKLNGLTNAAVKPGVSLKIPAAIR